jgi:predicted N-acetyltransferase YhbS
MKLLVTFSLPGSKSRIGSKLVEHGLERARSLGFRSVIVLGHERYYPRFGFMPASNFDIHAPFDVPDTAFMGLELREDALKLPNGVVLYAKEFGV